MWIWTQNTFFFTCFTSRHSFFKFGGCAQIRRSGGLRSAPLVILSNSANQLREKCKHCSAICEILLYGFWLAKLVTWVLYLIWLAKIGFFLIFIDRPNIDWILWANIGDNNITSISKIFSISRNFRYICDIVPTLIQTSLIDISVKSAIFIFNCHKTLGDL